MAPRTSMTIDPATAKRFQSEHMRGAKFKRTYNNISEARRHIVQQLDPLHNDARNP
jgi:hypothetical protein